MLKLVVLFCFIIHNNVYAQSKQDKKNYLSSVKDNELYFKKNIIPIFKSSCSCHQGLTDYKQVLPKTTKILEVLQPGGKMSSHLNKDDLPIIKYWIQTIDVKN